MDRRALELPESPKIVRRVWDLYEDSSGDEGIEIEVIFEENTTDEEIETDPSHGIKGRILDSLRRHHVSDRLAAV